MILRQVCFAIALGAILSQTAEAAPPFQNAQPQPTSTPYFNLFNGSRSPSPYQTLVRPQIVNEARFRENQLDLDRLERKDQALRRLAKLPPPPLIGPQPKRGISPRIRATGHQTRFLDNRRFTDYRQYFPPPVLR